MGEAAARQYLMPWATSNEYQQLFELRERSLHAVYANTSLLPLIVKACRRLNSRRADDAGLRFNVAISLTRTFRSPAGLSGGNRLCLALSKRSGHIRL